ncbi:MAG: hypothetical protein AB7F28_06005 [Candidatus Margulisiibacteriota bacterium]
MRANPVCVRALSVVARPVLRAVAELGSRQMPRRLVRTAAAKNPSSTMLVARSTPVRQDRGAIQTRAAVLAAERAMVPNLRNAVPRVSDHGAIGQNWSSVKADYVILGYHGTSKPWVHRQNPEKFTYFTRNYGQARTYAGPDGEVYVIALRRQSGQDAIKSVHRNDDFGTYYTTGNTVVVLASQSAMVPENEVLAKRFKGRDNHALSYAVLTVGGLNLFHEMVAHVFVNLA